MEFSREKKVRDDLLRWIKILALPTAKKLAKESLLTKGDMLIFELTDGQRTAVDIAKKTTSNKDTVSRKWKAWHAKGLLEKVGRSYKKRFSLSEIGFGIGG